MKKTSSREIAFVVHNKNKRNLAYRFDIYNLVTFKCICTVEYIYIYSTVVIDLLNQFLTSFFHHALKFRLSAMY